ncbi:hypothetical protein ACPPVO_08255 [Dactylosporangium sp. McL0621]|uniref:hypothetical protein n=1 Tax=Dactylosporangium sp. McL0621 TaxID=3415678 RepID=UPI003CE8A753
MTVGNPWIGDPEVLSPGIEAPATPSEAPPPDTGRCSEPRSIASERRDRLTNSPEYSPESTPRPRAAGPNCPLGLSP